MTAILCAAQDSPRRYARLYQYIAAERFRRTTVPSSQKLPKFIWQELLPAFGAARKRRNADLRLPAIFSGCRDPKAFYDPARRGLYIGLLDLQKKLQLMQPERIVELHAEVRGGSGHSGVKKRPEWNQNKSSLLRSPIAADQ